MSRAIYHQTFLASSPKGTTTLKISGLPKPMDDAVIEQGVEYARDMHHWALGEQATTVERHDSMSFKRDR